ncbi:unnamed protein product [Diatraea saccharalis]|uniref:Peptidase M14 domain-containing protein n=1 Tax=Diatraea saccharalis TaxID=40085 RepID=A0A9N9R2M8_9NEOP|nr:unnamed protein product [Diatraea saccharalis]
MVLYPWSGKSTPTELKATHNVTASGLCQAIYKHSKKKYKYGHTYHVVYPASGSAMDWIYDTGIVHTYVIEGQDKGYYGFLMPPEQIEDAGMEMLAAVKYLANTLNDQKPGESKSKSWF